MNCASKIMAHFCTLRCFRRIYDGDHNGDFVCRKPKRLKLIPNNTKHLFIKLPMKLTTECTYIIVDVQLKKNLV